MVQVLDLDSESGKQTVLYKGKQWEVSSPEMGQIKDYMTNIKSLEEEKDPVKVATIMQKLVPYVLPTMPEDVRSHLTMGQFMQIIRVAVSGQDDAAKKN